MATTTTSKKAKPRGKPADGLSRAEREAVRTAVAVLCRRGVPFALEVAADRDGNCTVYFDRSERPNSDDLTERDSFKLPAGDAGPAEVSLSWELIPGMANVEEALALAFGQVADSAEVRVSLLGGAGAALRLHVPL